MTSQASGPDERQGSIVEALHERSPKLAGIYRSALSTLRAAPEVGCESARVAIVCHCMRELMNGLPGVMADTAIPRPNPSSSSIVAQLPKLLADHPEVDLGLDQDMIPVPRSVARTLDQLVIARIREVGRNRSNAAALITGNTDDEHPAIKQWTDAYTFFVDWSHLDRNHERRRELPSNEVLIEMISVVEDVVRVRTAAFFENLRSVQDLLSQINATNDEGE